MVSVATQESKNPMQTVAQALHVPKAEMIISSSLSLPMKLMFPRDLLQRIGNTISILAGNSGSHTASTSGRRVDYSIIGLGDIALPGLLIALSRFLDLRERGSATAASSAAGMGARSRRGHVGYFVCSFFGYIVGTYGVTYPMVLFSSVSGSLRKETRRLHDGMSHQECRLTTCNVTHVSRLRVPMSRACGGTDNEPSVRPTARSHLPRPLYYNSDRCKCTGSWRTHRGLEP